MPTGIYARHKKVKNPGHKLDFSKKRDDDIAVVIARAKKPVHLQDVLTQEQLDMPFDELVHLTVSNALAIASTKKVEEVTHPEHYGGDTPMEVIKVLKFHLTREEFIGAMKFNIVKYNLRAGKKVGVEHIVDINKAAFYQNYLKEFLEKV